MPKYVLYRDRPHYEWIDGALTLIELGQEVEMSEDRASRLKDRFKLAVVAQAEADPAPPAKEETPPPPPAEDPPGEDPYAEEKEAVKEMSAKEARETVIYFEDVEVLLALLAVEKRTTVIEAIETRLEQLHDE